MRIHTPKASEERDLLRLNFQECLAQLLAKSGQIDNEHNSNARREKARQYDFDIDATIYWLPPTRRWD